MPLKAKTHRGTGRPAKSKIENLKKPGYQAGLNLSNVFLHFPHLTLSDERN
jgi:hypothetical protein